jgi:hypothetical protein
MHTFSALLASTYVYALMCSPCPDAGSTTLNDMPVQTAMPVTSPSNTAERNELTPVDIALVVNGKALRAQGAGQCKHEPHASIYNVPASLWRVEYGAPKSPEVQQVSLTVWQLKNGGGNQLSLALKFGSNSYMIATVKGGKMVGTGTVTFQPEQSGGRFEIQGADARGATIVAEIRCPSFSNLVAEGG